MVFQRERKYEKLLDVLEQQKALLKRLTDDTESPGCLHDDVTRFILTADRLVPVYFFVGFFGDAWEEDLRGKKFIYKKPTRFNLPVMYLLSLFSLVSPTSLISQEATNGGSIQGDL